MREGTRWALGVLLLSSFLVAGQESTGVISERWALMRALGDDVEAIWEGLARGDTRAVEQGATRIAAQATRMSTLFPPDSFHPPSRAESAIREEFHTFEGLAQELKAAAEGLATSARHAGLVEVQPHLARLIRACRHCHRNYVQPY